MEISHARISSSLGVFPKPSVGDCAGAACQTASAITGSKNLNERIMDAPIAGHSPRLDHVVRALHAVRLVIIRRLMKVLRQLAAIWLHLAEFVRAARLQHTFLAIPLPV